MTISGAGQTRRASALRRSVLRARCLLLVRPTGTWIGIGSVRQPTVPFIEIDYKTHGIHTGPAEAPRQSLSPLLQDARATECQGSAARPPECLPSAARHLNSAGRRHSPRSRGRQAQTNIFRHRRTLKSHDDDDEENYFLTTLLARLSTLVAALCSSFCCARAS